MNQADAFMLMVQDLSYWLDSHGVPGELQIRMESPRLGPAVQHDPTVHDLCLRSENLLHSCRRIRSRIDSLLLLPHIAWEHEPVVQARAAHCTSLQLGHLSNFHPLHHLPVFVSRPSLRRICCSFSNCLEGL